MVFRRYATTRSNRHPVRHRCFGWFFRTHRSEAYLKEEPSRVVGLILNVYSAVLVFLSHLFQLDAAIAIGVSMLSVLLCDAYGLHVAMNMNYGMISFGIVFPISGSISSAFARRERALCAMLAMFGYSASFYNGHVNWDWPSRKSGELTGGRKSLPEAHVESVHRLLDSLLLALQSYLLTPRGGHARFYYTPCGVREANALQGAMDHQAGRVERAFSRLTMATEQLKAYGLSGSEASRLHQFVQKMQVEWQLVRVIKEYRTPHALRSFARVYISIQGAILAPYFVYLAHQTNDAWSGGTYHASRLVYALLFCCTVSIMMCGLLSVALELENPFREASIDAVRVHHEIERAAATFRRIGEDAARGGDVWMGELESDEEVERPDKVVSMKVGGPHVV